VHLAINYCIFCENMINLKGYFQKERGAVLAEEILVKIVTVLNDVLWSYVLIVLLIGGGTYFTLRTKFVQIRLLGEMLRLLGEGVGKDKKKGKGVSSFQAFCISTASRVGTGNLAGIAMAVALGGPGAVFWMWLIALIGAASGFVESTLAQIYKIHIPTGYRGGPAYYIEKGLKHRWMGIVFAIFITLSFGLVFNSVHANSITVALKSAYGIDRTTMGALLAIMTGIVIFGGVERIASLVEWMVPFKAGGYILLAAYVIIKNITMLPDVLLLIFQCAFGIKAVVGGGVGAAMMMGIKRGLFSNEAGMGSVPNAAAAAEVSHPVKQGLIQALGVFVDTFLVCSSTAFIVLLSGIDLNSGLSGIELTQAALSVHVGHWAYDFIAIIVLLFAFSSIVSNYYYGETNLEFIKKSKLYLILFRIAVVAMVFFGSVAKVDIVWDLADLFMAFMAIINMIAILCLGKVAFAALNDYCAQKKAGKNPVFYSDSIEGLGKLDCWEERPVQEKR